MMIFEDSWAIILSILCDNLLEKLEWKYFFRNFFIKYWVIFQLCSHDKQNFTEILIVKKVCEDFEKTMKF